MIDRISNIESVGSAAVQAGIEHTEQHLAKDIETCRGCCRER